VSCLNCGVQLYIELPPGVVNFQCCQCYAVHKVIQPDPAAAAEENRKRKRKDRKGGPSESRDMPMTPYNKFMREELQSIKEANPSLSHRDAFKQASAKVECHAAAAFRLGPCCHMHGVRRHATVRVCVRDAGPASSLRATPCFWRSVGICLSM
jgi:hypothetical protein